MTSKAIGFHPSLSLARYSNAERTDSNLAAAASRNPPSLLLDARRLGPAKSNNAAAKSGVGGHRSPPESNIKGICCADR